MSTRYVVGVDLGQAHDPTAVVMLDRGAEPGVMDVRRAERYPLGMPYEAQMDRLAEFLHGNDVGLRAYGADAAVVMDDTGLGRPVIEMARKRIKPWPQGVTITSGSASTGDDIGWRVPKQDLIGTLQVALQNKALRISPAMGECRQFVSELKGYSYELYAGGARYSNDPRRSAHDDLVIALALAVWWAARTPYSLTATDQMGVAHYPPDPSERPQHYVNQPERVPAGVMRYPS